MKTLILLSIVPIVIVFLNIVAHNDYIEEQEQEQEQQLQLLNQAIKNKKTIQLNIDNKRVALNQSVQEEEVKLENQLNELNTLIENTKKEISISLEPTETYYAGYCYQIPISDIPRGSINYSSSRDRDKDGIACES